MARRNASAHISAAHAGGDQQEGSSARISSRCSAGRSRSPATSCASSSAAAENAAKSAIPSLEEDPGKPDDQAEQSRLRHRAPHRSGLPGSAKDAPARSAALLSRHQRSARRLSRQRLHRLPRRSTPTIAPRRTPAPTPQYGNQGQQRTARPHHSARTSPATRSSHQFTRSIPSSQCMVCHMHPGTNMVATYFGYTWWDNETDGEHM